MNGPSGPDALAAAHVRVREPAGTRELIGQASFGGSGADVVVPGVGEPVAFLVGWIEGEWRVKPVSGALRLNGEPVAGVRELRAGDGLALGEARVFVTEADAARLALEVDHLVGNATIPPLGYDAARERAADEEDLEIRAAGVSVAEPQAARVARRTRAPLGIAIAAALAFGAIFLLIASLEAVPLDVRPSEARVRAPGTLLAWRSGEMLFVLPGTHRVRAEHPEYHSAEQRIRVADGSVPTVRLRLAKLPGRLRVDTGGVAATVSINGAEVGRAPGVVEAPAGRNTITVRAARHLDHVAVLEVEGGGREQTLEVALQPAWGRLRILAEPAGAQIAVDGRAFGSVPRELELDAGVHRVRISAAGHKTWESSIVVRAGESQSLGPITLGAPDAVLAVRSRPAGAQVAVGGVYRGRTPLEVALAPGVTYDVAVTQPGYSSFTRSFFAASGERTAMEARLTPRLARLTVQGEPAGAEVLVDGRRRGTAPVTLEVSAGERQLEVRRSGFQPYSATVLAEVELPRTVEYRLLPSDRAQALLLTAPTLRAQGHELRLVAGGLLLMGAGRREQGRRPNEPVLRRVSLARPFYIGMHEVTNAQFRRFRREHRSGFIDQRTLDLDAQPVVRVSWDDAAAYCNWLSEREGLTPAYERSGDRFVLRQPVGNGFRLPTEAEWEFAARHVPPDRLRRYGWGDELPVPARAGNIAGAEAAGAVEAVLEGYRDDYVVSAPVGKFATSPLGLYDIDGNVSEWVNDHYSSFIDSGPVTDPLGPEQGQAHVVRGPSWRTGVATELRLAFRDMGSEANVATGFRIARYLDPAPGEEAAAQEDAPPNAPAQTPPPPGAVP